MTPSTLNESDSDASESKVRRMRDRIYGPCTDLTWWGCKDWWMRQDEVKWLEEQVERMGE